ncbi:uncharacterized protein FIBRA_04020 [Fibroporia radiculosa]|uniref:N-acetyltransferase domain-containing protein n=1 Tax=Fibroporia radiculosa TaxID=599839 RepID=J4HWB0_9APHY|nr:uncharacterized protein FIBRA_04020 [Fibroporia radiculosa]CCM01947.1 predicted protein [Fibroporia radiculosa]
MAVPEARIRPFKVEEKRLVNFLIAKGDMEALATANRRGKCGLYFHPLSLALWIGLSCVFIQLTGMWPKPEQGFLGYASPVPGLAAIAVPLMFLCDWINRPIFEEQADDDLRRPDLIDVPSYYSRSPSSGFWILEFSDKVVGFIAVDASLDSTSDKTIASSPAPIKRKDGRVKYSEGTSKMATIRHFYVDEPYRTVDIQSDLLSHAVQQVFASSPVVERIRASETPLKSYIGNALRKCGFEFELNTEKVGVLRWQNTIQVLKRQTWKKRSAT